jgi:hypothetical protein
VKNLACSISLLIFVLAVTLGILSYFEAQEIQYQSWTIPPSSTSTFGDARVLRFECAQATFAFSIESVQATTAEYPRSGLSRQSWHAESNLISGTRRRPLLDFRIVGIEFDHDDWVRRGYNGVQTCVVLPFWLFLPAAIPPILWLRRWRKNRGRGFPVDTAAATPPQ